VELVSRIIFMLTLMAICLPCSAQDPFSELEFRFQGSQNVGPNDLRGYWQLARGGKVSVSTPFYAGNWDLSIAIHRFNASSEVPGFGALWIGSGWGINFSVHPKVTVRPMIGIGNYRMSFDDSAITFSGESSESDFARNLGMVISFDTGHRWFVFSQAEYLVVHTKPRLNLWFLSIGIGLRMPSGEFIRAILK